MTKSEGVVQNGFVLRVSLPASGEMAGVGAEMAVKLAEQLGLGGAGAADVGAAVARLTEEVSPAGDDDVVVEFHKSETELTIEARQAARSSEARIPLPA